MIRVNAWNTYDEGQQKSCMDLAEDYKEFLSSCKTERECVDRFVNEAEANGYRELNEVRRESGKLKAGDRVYSVWMNKSMVLFEIGKAPFEDGINIVGAHIDSPRLDVKQNPLYEDSDIAYLDTHYYGGIKKYQYVTIPLAIHGVIVKKNGETVILRVGEDEDDPVFFISDLLIHLSQEQMKKPAASVIEGEALDLIVGSKPIRLEENDKDQKEENGGKEAVKKALLGILKDYYGIEEDDFESAELEVVPAGKAREAGVDSSMIMGYGHDDRVCAFTSLKAMLAVENPEYTTCCLLVDKEEIGSVGATGMQSKSFEIMVAEILSKMGIQSELALKKCFANSRMLSSDVSAAYDPTFKAAYEKKNAAFFGKGMVFNKFTGSRGKSGSNDANAEYMAKIRAILDKDGVMFQTSELGKVDVGGGGTIAYIMALYGMQVIDCGVAVLNMHAPWEIVSKADVYETEKGYEVFLKNIFS